MARELSNNVEEPEFAEDGRRLRYRNGDPIDLQWGGCDGCNPCMIWGRFCHEIGCPEAWRDLKQYVRLAKDCRNNMRAMLQAIEMGEMQA